MTEPSILHEEIKGILVDELMLDFEGNFHLPNSQGKVKKFAKHKIHP